VRAVVVWPGPAFSVADVARGWSKGLRDCGVDVVDFQTGDTMTFYERALQGMGLAPDDHEELGREVANLAAGRLRQLCYDWWPDLVVIVSAFFVPPDTYGILRSRGHKVAVLLTESPYEDDNQVPIAAHADVVCVNDPTNLGDYRAVNLHTHYLPHAYDPDLHHPGPAVPGYESDFCFVGTGYPERINFLESVDFRGADVSLAGNWSDLTPSSPLLPMLAHDQGTCCPNDEAVRMYRSTKASANIYRRSAQRDELSEGWAMGPREVELAASGTFFLTQARGENLHVLPTVPKFSDPGEFGDQLAWWLAHPDQRADVTAKAREAVADRTFAANAARLLELCGL